MDLPPAPPLAHCYRHPDRETGRRCTRCGKPACGECLATASVGSLCVDCRKAARPDARTRARYWNARQPTLVTYALIAVNAAVFLWTASDTTRLREARIGLFSRGIVDGSLRGVAEGDWWRLVSCGFLHFTILHVAMNMLLLFQLGQMLEPAIGRVRFGLVYLASLLGGSAGALLVSPDALTGGASGAVFGLMAAAAVGMKQRGINVFSTGLGAVLALNLVLTFTLANVSAGGHIGGALAGALCALAVMAPQWRGVPAWATYAAPLGVAAASVAVALVSAGG